MIGTLGDASASTDSTKFWIDTALDVYQRVGSDTAALRYEKAKAELQRLLTGNGSLKEIGTARAALLAAERDLQLEAEALRSQREWATLGKWTLVAGVGVLLAISVFILSKAGK